MTTINKTANLFRIIPERLYFRNEMKSSEIFSGKSMNYNRLHNSADEKNLFNE